MKTILSIAVLLISQFATADVGNTFNVPADFTVQYYTNEMPTIIIDGQDPVGSREIWSVTAIVEFCATKSPSDFNLEIDVTTKANYLQLTANQSLIDCMGPTHRQEMRYSMPKDANTMLPFFSAMPIYVDYEGAVY